MQASCMTFSGAIKAYRYIIRVVENNMKYIFIVKCLDLPGKIVMTLEAKVQFDGKIFSGDK